MSKTADAIAAREAAKAAVSKKAKAAKTDKKAE